MRDGVFDAIEGLIPEEFLQAVAAAEGGAYALSVLKDARVEIGGDAGIERTVALFADEVNITGHAASLSPPAAFVIPCLRRNIACCSAHGMTARWL
jgi:hypothetical protein